MNKQTEWVVVGRFGRPQGLKGLVRVISFTEPANNIIDYMPWHVSIQGQWQPIKISAVESHTKFILVQVDGYQQREQLGLLTNCEIGIQSQQLPTLSNDEFYWHDLIGMQVINQEEKILGTVTDLLATGSNDVLVVTGEKRHLVPYLLDDFIVRIDTSTRTIYVNWDTEF